MPNGRIACIFIRQLFVYVQCRLKTSEGKLLEATVRNLKVSLILIGAFALGIGPSLAQGVSLHKHTAEELKAVCDKAGGSFSQDAEGYGCGTNCKDKPGTDCVVACKNGQDCIAQVSGRGRPTNLLNALVRSPRR